jgi:hypothetical protein
MATSIAIVVARPRSRSPGLTTNPAKVMRGSTTHPLSRSRTTEAKVAGVSPFSWESRETRTTSPPMVVGSTLETNWPAR